MYNKFLFSFSLCIDFDRVHCAFKDFWYIYPNALRLSSALSRKRSEISIISDKRFAWSKANSKPKPLLRYVINSKFKLARIIVRLIWTLTDVHAWQIGRLSIKSATSLITDPKLALEAHFRILSYSLFDIRVL